jgi:hypothetical protein
MVVPVCHAVTGGLRRFSLTAGVGYGAARPGETMAMLQAFAELARAMHQARYDDALALIDALLRDMPEAGVLRRQRETCVAALQREAEAARVTAPELIRVDAALFGFDQQAFCNAPTPDLRTLGFAPLFDAASPGFSRHSTAPVLIRFFGDEGGDSVVVCFSAQLRGRALRLLACVSAFSDEAWLLTHRETELAIASTAAIEVQGLPHAATLTELVTRHAGRRATRLRLRPEVGPRRLRSLIDCDGVWRMIAGT